jgi:hypothetical protein
VKVAVVTSVYGDYDPIRVPAVQTLHTEWLCVTDGQTDVPTPWQTIIEPRPHLHPRMAGKVARCRPDFYTDADVTIWLDASAGLPRRSSVAALCDALGDGEIAQFPHPDRSDVLSEAEVSAGMRKYRGQPMAAQVAHYRKLGMPGGLWATGCIVRRNTPTVRAFGDTWLVEMMRWSWQDQLSEPYALWKHGLAPVAISGGLWSNPHVSFDYTQRRRDD